MLTHPGFHQFNRVNTEDAESNMSAKLAGNVISVCVQRFFSTVVIFYFMSKDNQTSILTDVYESTSSDQIEDYIHNRIANL